MPTYKHPCPRCDHFIERDVKRGPFCAAIDPFVPGQLPDRALPSRIRAGSCPSGVGAPRRGGADAGTAGLRPAGAKATAAAIPRRRSMRPADVAGRMFAGPNAAWAGTEGRHRWLGLAGDGDAVPRSIGATGAPVPVARGPGFGGAQAPLTPPVPPVANIAAVACSGCGAALAPGARLLRPTAGDPPADPGRLTPSPADLPG